jgi:hypothetical protein
VIGGETMENDLKPLENLINLNNDAWEECKALLEEGNNQLNILDVPSTVGEKTLYQIQVTTASYLGVIAYKTGGILVDHGWIKLLGSPHKDVFGDLVSWNGLSSNVKLPLSVIEGAFMIAYDVSGGFFAINVGKFGAARTVFYFAPDCLEWEDTELTYSEFIQWLASGDLQLFYETCRFEGWKGNVGQLEPDQVLSYYPPLWSKEGSGAISEKKQISIIEAWKNVIDHS